MTEDNQDLAHRIAGYEALRSDLSGRAEYFIGMLGCGPERAREVAVSITDAVFPPGYKPVAEVTEDMSTDAVAARVRQVLKGNEDWFDSLYFDRDDIINNLVGDITAAVTGDHPPVDAESLPEPVLLRTFPLTPAHHGQVMEYRLQFEVQSQWLEIAALVYAAEARDAVVRCYRVGNVLVARIEAVDGSVYAQVSRLLDGVW